MHVTIHTAAVPNGTTNISPGAAQMVRMGFNLSKSERVDRIKALAAALISECEGVRSEGGSAREASIAITDIQSGCMFAVAAATAEA